MACRKGTNPCKQRTSQKQMCLDAKIDSVTSTYVEGEPVKTDRFPTFTKELYFSVFPNQIPDKHEDDDKPCDHSDLLKQMVQLGSSNIGLTYKVMRKDLRRYACTKPVKPDLSLLLAMTKMDSRRVDYVDAVRATDPFLERRGMSPFLCKILFIFRSSLPFQVEYYYFVSEFYREGFSLCNHLQNVKSLSEEEALFYISELLVALEFIHSKKIIHRRLSLCAMLLEPYGHLKLAPYTLCDQNLDCGQACNPITKCCGEQFYAAPEVVFGTDVLYCADWWSVGVLLYQLITGKFPFTGSTLGELGKAITEFDVIIPPGKSPEVSDLILKLLHKDPRRRLGFGPSGVEEVKTHPFFRSLVWETVAGLGLSPPYVPKDNEQDLHDARVKRSKKFASKD